MSVTATASTGIMPPSFHLAAALSTALPGRHVPAWDQAARTCSAERRVRTHSQAGKVRFIIVDSDQDVQDGKGSLVELVDIVVV